jgi:hypothetical protein
VPFKNLIDGAENGVPAMISVCSGCKKAVHEDETSMCIHCSSVFCDGCISNCACQQALNQIWDAEEAAATRVAALAVN